MHEFWTYITWGFYLTDYPTFEINLDSIKMPTLPNIMNSAQFGFKCILSVIQFYCNIYYHIQLLQIRPSKKFEKKNEN